MLSGEGARLPASIAAWLAAFVVAMVVGAICLAVHAWIAISLRLPHFLQPSLEEVAGSVLIDLHYYFRVSAGVLAAVVLLAVVSAILIRLRRGQRNSEMSLVGPDRLPTRAALLVLACVLLMGASEIARWYGGTMLRGHRHDPDPVPGARLFEVSDGLFIGAGVVAALALAQATNAVVRRIRSRSANGGSPPVHREDVGSIPDRVPPGALSYWVLGFVVVAAAGSLCLWLGQREVWLAFLDPPAPPGLPSDLDLPPGFFAPPEIVDLRPDAIEVTGRALRAIGHGLLVGAGVRVALAWLRFVRATDSRPAELLTGARILVTGFGVMVLAAAIVHWLIRSVILVDPQSGTIPVTELYSIILFGWIVLWETEVSEVMLTHIVRRLAFGLIVGTAVAAIPALLQSYPLVKQRLGGAGAYRDGNTPPALAAAPGFIAALLAGGLCLTLGLEVTSLGREVILVDPPRSWGVLIPIQLNLSAGLFIGAGVLAAVMVTVALGALQRRVSERRSQDSPA